MPSHDIPAHHICGRGLMVHRIIQGSMTCAVILASYLLTICPRAFSQNRPSASGFLDFNIYPITTERQDSVFTLNALANLSEEYQYFSFVNLGHKSHEDSYEHIDSFYTEQNARWKVFEESPLQLTAQLVLRTGHENEIFRLGLRYPVHELPVLKELTERLNLQYWLNLHALQLDHQDGYQWQIEHAFRTSILEEMFEKRLYMSGFADHTIDTRAGKDTWVEEAQFGFRLVDQFYVVLEQRYNGYRRNKENALGAGLEYNYLF